MNYSVNKIKRGAINLTIYQIDAEAMQSTYYNISNDIIRAGFHIGDAIGLAAYLNRDKSKIIKVAEISCPGLEVLTLRMLKEIRQIIVDNIDEDTVLITRYGLEERDLEHQRNHVFEALGFKDFNFFCGLENSTVDIYPNAIGLEIIHLAQELNFDKYDTYKKTENIVIFDKFDYQPEKHKIN